MHALMIFYDFFKAFFSDNSQKHGGVKVQTSISFEYSATLNDFRRCTSRMITNTTRRFVKSRYAIEISESVVECWYLCLKKKFSKINLIVKKIFVDKKKNSQVFIVKTPTFFLVSARDDERHMQKPQNFFFLLTFS